MERIFEIQSKFIKFNCLCDNVKFLFSPETSHAIKPKSVVLYDSGHCPVETIHGPVYSLQLQGEINEIKLTIKPKLLSYSHY